MKRISVDNNKILKLSNSERSYELSVVREIGSGASCISYDVRDVKSGMKYVLKECFPARGAYRGDTGEIVWESAETEQTAKNRFLNAYEIQKTLQSHEASQNDLAHLTDSILEGNNTYYILIDPRNAVTYDKAEDDNLQQVFITAKAIAEAVGEQHKLGYLNLDIKPENVMVYPKTREMVLLLDFDSLVKKDDICNLRTLSYSPKYAAPELLQGRKGKVSEGTDLYSIGAIVFERIFGRTPDADDRCNYSEPDYSSTALMKAQSGKAKRLINDFLKKSITSVASKRYSSCAEMIADINSIVTETAPGRRFLNSTNPMPVNTFIGRKNEMEEIRSAFENGEKIVVLHGIGGIGKTSIAINYAYRNAENFNAVCFGKYLGSLEAFFMDRGIISISNDEEHSDINSFRELADSNTLLIVDNLDTLDDKHIPDLLSLPCKILITSRCDFAHVYPEMHQLEVCELSPEAQLELFMKKSGCDDSEEEISSAKEILAAVEGYTLLIPLLAEIYRNGTYSLEELAKSIKKSGINAIPEDKVRIYKDTQLSASSFNILCTVLDMSSFTDAERYVMGSVSLLRNVRYDREQLLKWIGKEYNTALNALAERGWIQIFGSGKSADISMHIILSQVYAEQVSLRFTDFPWVAKIMEEFLVESRDLSKNSTGYYGGFFDEETGYSYSFSSYTKDRAHNEHKLISFILQNIVFEDVSTVTVVVDYLYEIHRPEYMQAFSFLDEEYSVLCNMSPFFEQFSPLTIARYYYVEFVLLMLFFQKTRLHYSEIAEYSKIAIDTAECSVNNALFGTVDRKERNRTVIDVLLVCFEAGIHEGRSVFSIYDSEKRENYTDNYAAEYFEDAVERIYKLAVDYSVFPDEGRNSVTSMLRLREMFHANMSQKAYYDMNVYYDDLRKEAYKHGEVECEDNSEYERIQEKYFNGEKPETAEEKRMFVLFQYYGISPPTDEEIENRKHQKKKDELQRQYDILIGKCLEMGFGSKEIPNSRNSVYNEENQLLVENCLAEMNLLQAEMNAIPYVNNWGRSFEEYCINANLCFARNSIEQAITMYKKALGVIDFGNGSVREVLGILERIKEYDSEGFIKVAVAIIDYFDTHCFKTYHIAMNADDRESNDDKLESIDYQIELAELINDDNLVKKYKKKRNALLGTNYDL